MLFNSYIFILIFLPIVLLVYFDVSRYSETIGKWSLIISSVIFIGYFKSYYLVVLSISLMISYLINSKITKEENDKSRKWMILGIVFNVLFLGVFKYTNFMIENINYFGGTNFNTLNILLPLGVSFYTFSQISYMVDNYKGEIENTNLTDYMLFVTFFPKFIQGPIASYKEFIEQFQKENIYKFNYDNFSKGLYLFALGLSKKVLVADTFGKIVDYGHIHITSLNSLEAILTIVAYTLQLYFDFSGYCDMASATARMFNIELPHNFNSPYKSRNITDFWKRWHITLNQFLTKYVYIPLGGSRKNEMRTFCNIMIVFLISGIWHGVGYTFIIWGLLQGVASVLYRIMKKPYGQMPTFIQWIINFCFINISWTFFRATSISNALAIFGRILSGGFGINAELMEAMLQPTIISVLSRLLPFNIVIIFMTIIFVFVTMCLKNSNELLKDYKPDFKMWIQTYVLLVLSILSLSGVSTFLYFNF